MNPAIACIEDTLRLLLEEAKQSKATALAQRGSSAEGFEVGRSEALAEALHTWANQLRTFGLDAQLDGIWEELRGYLSNRGFGENGDLQNTGAAPGAAADRPRE